MLGKETRNQLVEPNQSLLALLGGVIDIQTRLWLVNLLYQPSFYKVCYILFDHLCLQAKLSNQPALSPIFPHA